MGNECVGVHETSRTVTERWGVSQLVRRTQSKVMAHVSVARETVRRAKRHVCGASGIEGVRGRHSAAASWRPYWPGKQYERVH
ncbi:MAG TPA: hypothetical protein VL485_25210 [Ktedonobacteraceae bacterium]|nr:hypothetical protein [Ktedonobacteraceae bacterium]